MGSGCLHWAECGVELIAKMKGLRAIVQAGSTSWPIVTKDDGG